MDFKPSRPVQWAERFHRRFAAPLEQARPTCVLCRRWSNLARCEGDPCGICRKENRKTFPVRTRLLAARVGNRALRLETSVRVLDPEGAHLAALLRLGNFRGLRVLEHGCGEGRLTVGIAADAASVLAFDPDATAIESARRSLPAELAGRVDYRVASGSEIGLEPRTFDLTVFSWSL